MSTEGKARQKEKTSKAVRKSDNKVLLWLKIIRPQTLFASLCPVLAGLLVVHKNIGYAGLQGNTTAILTIVCALALQILSNLINDYYDFKRGADKQGRVGFRRALAEGLVSESEMRTACFVALGVAVLTGAVLCYVGGWVILAIGVTAILFAWLYTATNYSLSYLGIADIFVFLYYGVIATCGTAWLQYKAVGINPQWATLVSQFSTVFFVGAVCGLISMCVLAINNIRDIDGDCEAGKRTFPVRFGKTAALVMFAVIVVLMPVFAYLAFALSPALLVIVAGGYLFYRVLRSKGAEYNQCLLMAGLVNVCWVVRVWLSV